MEKEFQEYKNGMSLREEYLEKYAKDYTKEKTMLDCGVLILWSGFLVINPIVAHCKSFKTACIKIKKEAFRWTDTITTIENKENNFREEMMDYFKDNPLPIIFDGSRMCAIAEGVPHKYSNGKGLAYIINGEVIAMHYGYRRPINDPSGTDVFNFSTELGVYFFS